MGFDLGHTISSLSKLALRTKRRIDKDWKTKDFSVYIFLGKDKVIRLVPGVRNKFGIYVPIPEGIEVPLTSNAKEIGKVYLSTANNALNHFGEDLDMRTAKPKYISFKNFKSQKEFNLKHFCFSSFALNEKIKFTFLPWHKNEFCLLKSDTECIVEITLTDDEETIGEAILNIIKKANEAYPDLKIL